MGKRSNNHISSSEARTLKKIRQEYSSEQCVALWQARRCGGKSFPSGFWHKLNHSIYLTHAFVSEWQENPQKFIEHEPILEEIIKTEEGKTLRIRVDELVQMQMRYPQYKDYVAVKLRSLIKCADNSPLRALVVAGFTDPNSSVYDKELAESPWIVLKQLPKNYFEPKEKIKYAVDWLCKKTDKKPNKLMIEDFVKFGLSGLIKDFSSSTHKTVRAAGYDIQAWEMQKIPGNFFADQNNRRDAIGWLEQKTGRKITELYRKEFTEHGLTELWYALPETQRGADTEVIGIGSFDPVPNTKEYFVAHPETRRAFIRTLVGQLNKKPEEITQQDIRENGLGVIYSIFDNMSALLKDSGYEFRTWARYVRNWDDETMKEAVQHVIDNVGKDITQIRTRDIEKFGLEGLLKTKRFDGSVVKLLQIVKPDLKPWHMCRVPKAFYASKENRNAVTNEIVKKAGGPDLVTQKDFSRYHRMFKYIGDMHGALLEAGYVSEQIK